MITGVLRYGLGDAAGWAEVVLPFLDFFPPFFPDFLAATTTSGSLIVTRLDVPAFLEEM